MIEMYFECIFLVHATRFFFGIEWSFRSIFITVNIKRLLFCFFNVYEMFRQNELFVIEGYHILWTFIISSKKKRVLRLHQIGLR